MIDVISHGKPCPRGEWRRPRFPRQRGPRRKRGDQHKGIDKVESAARLCRHRTSIVYFLVANCNLFRLHHHDRSPEMATLDPPYVSSCLTSRACRDSPDSFEDQDVGVRYQQGRDSRRGDLLRIGPPQGGCSDHETTMSVLPDRPIPRRPNRALLLLEQHLAFAAGSRREQFLHAQTQVGKHHRGRESGGADRRGRACGQGHPSARGSRDASGRTRDRACDSPCDGTTEVKLDDD
jgi:hypothetical protein